MDRHLMEGSYESSTDPWVEIVEQPKTTAMRFRYQCEGRSAGTILGASANSTHKSYPTIKIHNCGPAAVVVVSCVTLNAPYYPHPHSLVGNNCSNSVCTLRIKGKDTLSMTNVGIQCCKRNDVKKAIEERQKIRVDPFGTGYVVDLDKLDLSAVRLCFQVFLPDSAKKFTRVITPVVSNPIVDKKLVNNLSICRLSKRASTADGGDEVLLLCDKIKKEDIEVRFYEEDEDGEVVWEAFGQFNTNDVHHQCAITFKTPPYRDRNIEGPVTVQVQLRRQSDLSVGQPKEFQYIPNDITIVSDVRKRKAATLRDVTKLVESESAAAAATVTQQLASCYGASLVPLSVIQNDDNATDNFPPSSSSRPQHPSSARPSAAAAASHRDLQQPIDFSGRSSSWSGIVEAAAAVDNIKSENSTNSSGNDESMMQQLQYVDNGTAIVLNQTEDGRLVLPPGFRIILPDGTELSGQLDGNLVMALQQLEQQQQQLGVDGGGGSESNDGMVEVAAAVDSQRSTSELYQVLDEQQRLLNGEQPTNVVAVNGSASTLATS